MSEQESILQTIHNFLYLEFLLSQGIKVSKSKDVLLQNNLKSPIQK